MKPSPIAEVYIVVVFESAAVKKSHFGVLRLVGCGRNFAHLSHRKINSFVTQCALVTVV